jgi:hypothetical protein
MNPLNQTGCRCMARFVRTALILLVAGTFSHKLTSQEASPTATWQRSEMGNQGVEVMITTEGSPQATAPKPSLSTSNEALTVRRNAHFYSWRGNCYTQDRDQNWYRVDARLC